MKIKPEWLAIASELVDWAYNREDIDPGRCIICRMPIDQWPVCNEACGQKLEEVDREMEIWWAMEYLQEVKPLLS